MTSSRKQRNIFRSAGGVAMALAMGGASAGDIRSDPAERVPVKPVGWLFLDHARYADLAPAARDTRPTSLRLGIEGDLAERTSYELILEVAGAFRNGGTAARLRVATVNYRLSDRFNTSLGQHDEPFSLEAFGPAASLVFMERGLPYALVPTYHAGVLLRYERERGGAAAGVFERTLGPGDADRGQGVSMRAFVSPVGEAPWLVHIGTSVSYRAPRARAYSYASGPESAVAGEDLIDTGTVPDVRRSAAAGLELVVRRGPTQLQAEYMTARLDRTDGRPDPRFAGHYVGVSHFLTGERRSYDAGRGVMRELTADAPSGAIEVAVRVSRLDLNDAGVPGGLLRNTTFGINWYLRENLRLMTNYIVATRSRQGVMDNPRVLQFRLQVTW